MEYIKNRYRLIVEDGMKTDNINLENLGFK
jgi:hypothetical protein